MSAASAPRIVRISLTSADPGRLLGFYRDAFGFTPTGVATIPDGRYGVPGRADATRLALGSQGIELVRFQQPGAPVPPNSTSHDQWFQHMAIVTRDMAAAMAALERCAGWTPISVGGPVLLPASSGGVTCFKLRDPEGHPLELLSFPPGAEPEPWRAAAASAAGPCLGIDHTAMACADTTASLAFHRGLGFERAGGSVNEGPEQERLDAAPGVRVDVSTLVAAEAADADARTPHLELLAYRTPAVRPGVAGPADLAATRVVLQNTGRDGLLSDPDGHRFVLED